MKFIRNLFLLFLLITLASCTPNQEITYEISINNEISTDYEIGDSVAFNEFFIIKDSLGNTIDVDMTMIDVSDVDMNEAGTYVIKINYAGLQEQITITVTLPDETITYFLSINESISTTIEINTEDINFKEYFTITDSLGNVIEILDEMIDDSMVNLLVVGSYNLKLNYLDQSLSLIITVVDNTLPPITYTVTINDQLSTEITLGTENINFKDFFIITDSLDNSITVTDVMIDLSNVNLNEIGFFTITLTFEGIEKSIEFEVIAPDSIYANDLFISEYSEGSSNNKYIEIFNGTGESVDLSSYTLKLFNNAKSPAQYEFELSGILKDGELFVVYNGAANATIKDYGNVSNAVISFNGNDPIALYRNDVLIDIVGDLNTSVDKGYDIGGVLEATKDNTIIRKADVFGPNSTWNPDEWMVLGFEDYSDLKKHSMDYYEAPLPPKPIERTPDLFISEYFEGNGDYNDSKYIEIYNGLGHDVDLASYALNLYSNGDVDPKFVQPLSGILKDSDVYIVYAPYSAEEIKAIGNLASEVAFFNGRHAIALTKDQEIIDLFGIIGEYPDNNGWLVDGVTGTANNTLIRDNEVTGPTVTWNKDEWYVCYENYLYDIGQHNIDYENEVIEDFDLLFNLITQLELNDKGTATSTNSVTIKGTVYMDVENETTLVYITDGKSFIKLHGTKIHNYTSPNTVYEVTGNYKSYLYIPTFEVINPDTDITVLRDETPVTSISIKEVTLEEILNLKLENFITNINYGYLQSMLKLEGYLQLDTHNSTTWDYALTTQETYTKNNTQYINNGLYFKNDVDDLEYLLMDYEVDVDNENTKVSVLGVIYDWNPNRKNWRIYISDTLTSNFLESN